MHALPHARASGPMHHLAVALPCALCNSQSGQCRIASYIFSLPGYGAAQCACASCDPNASLIRLRWCRTQLDGSVQLCPSMSPLLRCAGCRWEPTKVVKDRGQRPLSRLFTLNPIPLLGRMGLSVKSRVLFLGWMRVFGRHESAVVHCCAGGVRRRKVFNTEAAGC